MKLLRSLALALACACSAAPAAARLSAAEQRMAATVDAEQARTVAMLERWVNQNSGSLNLPGVTAVGEMLRAELEPLGFKVEWIDMKSVGRAGHIVARHKGRGKRMLLIGHLDTVFEPDSPFQRWSRSGDWASGPGAVDNKGGVAVMVAALRAMKAAGTLRRADITVFLTGDEEDSGSPIEVARRDLIAEGKKADVALDFESLAVKNGKDVGSIARRSSNSWTVRVTAPSGHSSGIFAPGVGYGAIYEAARIVDAFRRELPEDKLTYSVGLIGGGATTELDRDQIRLSATGKTNVIPAVTIVRGDLRAISRDQIARTIAKMQAIVARSLPGTKAELSIDEGGYPPMAPTEGSRAFLARLNEFNADLGLEQMGELDPAERGAGDIGFVAADVDGLVGMGASGPGSHSDDEKVHVPTLFKQAKRAAILMSRLAATRR